MNKQNGYGDFSTMATNNAKHVYAHRYSYAIANGSISNGLCVLHRCDVRRCVRPSHLFLGTVRDNNRDKSAKGRARGPSAKGEENGRSKLTDEQVMAIRQAWDAGKPVMRFATEYGVDHALIYRVAHRKVWKHVTP